MIDKGNEKNMLEKGTKRLRNFSVRKRIVSLARVSAILIIVLGGLSFLATNNIKIGSTSYKEIVKGMELESNLIAPAGHIIESLATALQYMAVDDVTQEDILIDKMKAYQETYLNSYNYWKDALRDQEEIYNLLINEMLSSANLDANKKKGEVTKFELSKILSDALLVFEVVIFEKGLVLEENINDNIFINGEKDQIKKLISILMDNAIKYTNKNGKIMVSLNIEKNKARLEVKNTGEGIEKEHLEKIFERFYRVDNSRDRGTGGYGLGLSIAKAIVEEHKGKIYAESVVGEYTSFIVELPVYFEKQKLINDLKIGN